MIRITYFVHGTTLDNEKNISSGWKDVKLLTFENIVPIMIDKRLRECNYGDLNGSPSEIVEPMQEKNIKKPFPNGESYKDVENRIIDFLKDLKKDYDGKTIAIVAHKAPQLALDVILKKITWKQVFANDWRKTHSWQPGWKYYLKI